MLLCSAAETQGCSQGSGYERWWFFQGLNAELGLRVEARV